MKTLGIIAVVWLVLGVGIVIGGVPQSLEGGWRKALYLVLFGPPVYLLVQLTFETVGEVLHRIFVPKSIDNWRPFWRIAFYVFYAITILLFFVGALNFFRQT